MNNLCTKCNGTMVVNTDKDLSCIMCGSVLVLRVRRQTDIEGIRKLEKCLETIIMKLNLYSITSDIKYLNIKDKEPLNPPYLITIKMAASLLDPIFKSEKIFNSCQTMYT